jgi:hypothetical protein
VGGIFGTFNTLDFTQVIMNKNKLQAQKQIAALL